MTDEIPGETLLKFPCEYPIKIVGKANNEFETFVLSVLHQHFPDLTEGSLETRHSRDNTYLAITVTVNAISKAQLDAVYQELSTSKLVMMVL